MRIFIYKETQANKRFKRRMKKEKERLVEAAKLAVIEEIAIVSEISLLEEIKEDNYQENHSSDGSPVNGNANKFFS